MQTSIQEIVAEVTVYYLEMTDYRQLRPKRNIPEGFMLQQAEIPLPELNRFFYASVGVDWYWTVRLSWTYQQWQDWVERTEVSTWIGYLSGTPAGYFELAKQAGDDSVELAYFGVLPHFTGQGLGGHLLTCALEQAWRLNPKRVWLHTCSLDHPNALANYQARGFRLFREEDLMDDVPAEPIQPWGGANRD